MRPYQLPESNDNFRLRLGRSTPTLNVAETFSRQRYDYGLTAGLGPQSKRTESDSHRGANAATREARLGGRTP